MTKRHTSANVVFKTYEQGGRVQMPEGDGYAPYLRTSPDREDRAVRLSNIPANARLGDEVPVKIELMYYSNIAFNDLTIGTEFLLVEGKKIVATGVVTSFKIK